MGFGMWFGWVFWILLVAGVISLVVFGVRRGSHGCGHDHAHERSARDILDERYARGEINRDQYEQMKRDISG